MHLKDTIPYGYCHCGCGEKTSIIQRSNLPRGLVKGEPRLYLKGHHRRKPVIDGRRECSRCHTWVPLNEFVQHSGHTSGVGSWCKACVNQDSRRFREENPGRTKFFRARYKAANRDAVLRKKREHARKSASSVRETLRRWRENNPDRVRAQKWRRKSRETGCFSSDEWSDLKQRYGNRCLCCGRDDVSLTVDHVVPVSRGGSNDIVNIQPLCQSCNSKKGTRIIDFRMRPHTQLALGDSHAPPEGT